MGDRRTIREAVKKIPSTEPKREPRKSTTKRRLAKEAAVKRLPGQHGPKKSTVAAREAIGKFVDGNAHRLQRWLDQVAEGVAVPVYDKEGNLIEGRQVYVVPPNPEKAFNLFQSVVEYHVPKLARTEHAGDPDNPVQHRVETITRQIVKAK